MTRQVMNQLSRLSILLACLILGEAASADAAPPKNTAFPIAKNSYPFEVKVWDFYGAEGYGFGYYLNSGGLVVVLWDDFGGKRREVFQKTFTAEEQKRWGSFLTRFPVDTLKTAYSNHHVDDGLQMRFEFKLDGKAPKTVTLNNTAQKDLELLCAELNKVLPDGLKAHQPRGELRSAAP